MIKKSILTITALSALIILAGIAGTLSCSNSKKKHPAPESLGASSAQIQIPEGMVFINDDEIRFITLSFSDDYFAVNGQITQVAGFSDIESALEIIEKNDIFTKVRFKRSGYFGITVQQAAAQQAAAQQYFSIFVSPIPSKHADSFDLNFDWYKTQFNTGTSSNCGPASAAMAITLATGSDFPVYRVRQKTGWQGEGAVTFEQLVNVITEQGVEAAIKPLTSVQDIIQVIDSHSIAIIVFHTSGLSITDNDPAQDLFGAYYNESVGHYALIKGYSLDHLYFIVHDPLPDDWITNSFRYQDDVSMIGRNRYFLASEILGSLRRPDMIVAKVSD